ncbi:MAG: SDR family oxidoreductase [Ignavibacterium sp.]|nr:SDR family oxidoreductase [Ignavibacterium sp.]MDW8376172.1 SDR family oxidoreductase [Ignavibacteriales bacterium]
MKLENKVCLITGATGGIGTLISKRFSNEGAIIGLIGRNQSLLTELQKKLSNVNCFTIKSDLSDNSSILKAVEKVENKFGKIDVLVNCAAIQAPIGKFIDLELSNWFNNIYINLFGTVSFTYYCLKLMIRNKKGKIINFSGGGATFARKFFTAYAVSKTAIVRFTETLATEIKEFNIDVNAIAPGVINTKMLDEILQKGEILGDEYKNTKIKKEVGGDDPNLVADLVCFLASEDSNGITGKLISAQWDPWQDEEFRQLLKNDEDFAVLRRIDNKKFLRTL